MAYEHDFSRTFSRDGLSVSTTTEEVSASGQVNIQETIAANAEDLQINLALDVSALKSIFMLASTNMEINTNDVAGGAPDHTINLIAGRPLIWTINSYFASPFSGDATDVANIRVTNGAAEGSLQICALQDATP